MKSGVLVPVLAGVMLFAAAASAEPEREPAGAQDLFERGRAALDKGEVDTACGLLAESQRLDPAVGTLFNLAACEERQGKIASAWLHLREGIGQLPPNDARVRPAEERARALEARVPRLVVRLALGAPTTTVVRRDGVELSSVSLGLPLPVDPGVHKVVTSANGRAPSEVSVALRESEKTEIVVSPGALVDSVGTPASDGKSPARTVGYISGGVGIALVAGGAIAGLVAMGHADTVNTRCSETHVCDQDGLDALAAAKDWGTVSTVAFIAGAALVVTGVVLVLVSPSSGKTSGVRLAPAWHF